MSLLWSAVYHHLKVHSSLPTELSGNQHRIFHLRCPAPLHCIRSPYLRSRVRAMQLLNVVFHPMPFMQPTPCLAAVAVCVDSTEIICTVTACLGGGNGFMLQLVFIFIVSNKINSFLWRYIYVCHSYRSCCLGVLYIHLCVCTCIYYTCCAYT